MSAAGVQDVVILALKAQSVPAVAPTLRALYGAETRVVTAQSVKLLKKTLMGVPIS